MLIQELKQSIYKLKLLTDDNYYKSEGEEIISLVEDIERSIILIDGYDRKLNDKQNAQHRLIILETIISKMMNTAIINLKNKTMCGEILDKANSYVWYNNTTKFDKNRLTLSLEPYSLEEQRVFLINVIYETLQKINVEYNYKVDFRNPIEHIIKDMEFAPDELQSGLTVINTFSRIIKEKYGSEGVKVRVIQNDEKVVLVIETSVDQRKELENTFNQFNDVINGKAGLDKIVDNDAFRIQMEHSLEFAAMQLKHERERNVLFQGEILSLQDTLKNLSKCFVPLAESHKKSTFALTHAFEESQKALLKKINEFKEVDEDPIIRQSLSILFEALNNENVPNEHIINALKKVKSERPKIFEKIRTQAENLVLAGSVSTGVTAIYQLIINLL